MPQSLRGFGPPQNEAQTRAGIKATTPEWDGWLSQDGESHPNSIQALQALTGGGMRANDPLTLASLRRQSLEERSTPGEGGIGGFGPSPQFQAQVYRDLAQDPITGSEEHDRIKGIEAQQAAEQHYNSPFETARRKENENNALARLILPKQVEAQGHIEAARQSQIGHLQQQDNSLAAQSAALGTREAGLAHRQAVAARVSNLREEQHNLEIGKSKAPNSGWLGYGQSDANAKRLSDIKAELMQLEGGVGSGSPETPVQGQMSTRPSAADMLRKYGG